MSSERENRVHSLLRQGENFLTDMSNRVEYQKRNQTATSQWPVGFVIGVQLDYSCRFKSVRSDAEKVVHGSLRRNGTLFSRHE